MRRLSAVIAGLALFALALAGTAAPAGAQFDCAGPQTARPATVSSNTVNAGDQLTISGGGFEPNVVLGIGLFNPPVVLGTTASDSHGNFSIVIQIPPETPGGQNEITVFGEGPDGTCHQVLALFSVRATTTTVVTVVIPTVVTPTVVTVAVPHGVPVSTTVMPKIVVKQPLARTGSHSLALVAAGLVAILLGTYVVRLAGRGGAVRG